MNGTKKKVVLQLIFIFFCAFLVAQRYQIKSVEYEIDGVTREDRLSRAVSINTNAVFANLPALEKYLSDLQIRYQRQRVLQSALITPTYGEPNEQNIIPVDLLIYIEDSWNIMPVPYPKYDSNTGTEFKLKVRDYNFFGTMQTLDTEILYKYDTDDEANDHIFGASASFTLPFWTGNLTTYWSNSLNLNYTLGEDYPYTKFSTGLRFVYRINSFFSLDLRLTQSITYDSGDNDKYENSGDALYFTEYAYFGIPVTITRTTWGNLRWTPYISATYYWDPDGISHADFIDTDIIFGHSLWFGKGVQWNKDGLGNFRDGYSISFSQSFHKQLHIDRYYLTNTLNAIYYKSFEHVQLASRLYFREGHGNRAELGGRVRGIQTDAIKTDSAIIINFDLPIKVWQTDWVGYGLWGWTEWVDFELQISPFIDIAIGNNYDSKTNYDLKDGWYAAGLEILVHPDKVRSVQGRISFGVDVVKFADKVGNRIGFVEKVVDKLFGNTDWRWKNNDKWFELTFGIGLFY